MRPALPIAHLARVKPAEILRAERAAEQRRRAAAGRSAAPRAAACRRGAPSARAVGRAHRCAQRLPFDAMHRLGAAAAPATRLIVLIA